MTTSEYNVCQKTIKTARLALVTLPEHTTLRSYITELLKAPVITSHMAGTVAALAEQHILNCERLAALPSYTPNDPLNDIDL